MQPSLSISETENYIEVRFHKAAKRNSFGITEVEALSPLLKKHKPILFFSSLAGTFCSGGDLKHYASISTVEALKVNAKIRSFLKALSRHPCVCIAVVDGDCLGGGLEVLSAFDIIISSPSSLFSLWQRRIGLSYGWGGGKRLARRLGSQKLKEMSLSCRIINSYEAKNIGLVDYIFTRQELEEKALQIMKAEVSLSQDGMGLFKNFKAKNEVKVFESIWGNPTHEKTLAKFRK